MDTALEVGIESAPPLVVIHEPPGHLVGEFARQWREHRLRFSNRHNRPTARCAVGVCRRIPRPPRVCFKDER